MFTRNAVVKLRMLSLLNRKCCNIVILSLVESMNLYTCHNFHNVFCWKLFIAINLTHNMHAQVFHTMLVPRFKQRTLILNVWYSNRNDLSSASCAKYRRVKRQWLTLLRHANFVLELLFHVWVLTALKRERVTLSKTFLCCKVKK